MKKILFYAIAIMAVLPLASGCKKDKLMFSGPASIYFRLPSPDSIKDPAIAIVADTLTYTFAYSDLVTVSQRTILIPLEITGVAADHDRKYRIQVIDSANTTAGVDYVSLAPVQQFPAAHQFDTLQVTFLRNLSMQSAVKQVIITIQNGDDLVAGVKEKLTVCLRVSDMLSQPVWWNRWINGFGTYNSIKLREWFKIWGTTPLSTTKIPNWNFAPQELAAIVKLKAVFDKAKADGHPFVDENGIELTIPANF